MQETIHGLEVHRFTVHSAEAVLVVAMRDTAKAFVQSLPLREIPNENPNIPLLGSLFEASILTVSFSLPFSEKSELSSHFPQKMVLLSQNH